MKNALARARRTLVPASVLLTVTHRCQLACAHCWQAEHASDDLSTAELIHLMDELALLGTLQLVFSGGEALLRKDLLELVAQARARHFAVSLFTNGGPVTPEVARRLRELRVMSVEVSLHASHAAIHDGFVGRQGAFAKAVRAIELLDDEGIPVLVKTSVLRCNAGEVRALEALFAQRPRVRCLSDVLLYDRDDGQSVAFLRASPAQVASHYAAEAARTPDAEVRALGRKLAVLPPEESYATMHPCGAGRTFATVEPDGTVLACTHIPGKPLGNLREQSFSELWLSSPAAQELRALTLAKFSECAGCEYRHVCAKCPALSLSATGALSGHSLQICERTKAFWGAVKDRLAALPPDEPPQAGGTP